MSEYYYLWRANEAAKSALVLTLAAMVLVQLICYRILPRLVDPSRLRLAQDVYLVSVIVCNLCVTVITGMEVL